MNSNIQKLHSIASKESRMVIGLMSGTSLDGLDVALCEIKGLGLQTAVVVKEFMTVTYDDAFRNEIREVFAKKQADMQKLCLLNETIGIRHANIINRCLEKWRVPHTVIDMIASHGQTVYHAPKGRQQPPGTINGTLQIGDADHIAVNTGIITISDFRQKHVAAGGEGAPLAVYGDYLLFSKKAEERILLNIGGIANLTYLPGNLDTSGIICTDTGAGNTIMDAYMKMHFPGMLFDENGALAGKGNVNEKLLQALKDHEFFRAPFPKSTGPELFNTVYLDAAMEKSGSTYLPKEDIMATLNRFTADTIADAITQLLPDIKSIELFCSGGGVHNQTLMQYLQSRLKECKIQTTAALGIEPDAKEAVLFAVLANECLCGDPAVFSGSGKNKANLPAITMGKISFPG